MREFTERDWDCFAGAEEAKDGRQPMINDKENPLDISVVASEGSIQLIKDEMQSGNTRWWNLELPYDIAIIVAATVEDRLVECNNIDEVFSQIIAPLGFEKGC